MRKLLMWAVLLIVVAAAVLLGIYKHFDRESAELTDAVRASAGGRYVALALPLGAGSSSSLVTPMAAVTHYELAGPQDAQTVVLVHGFTVPYYIWDPMFDGLVRAGFRVLRYDLYGRGYSDRPEVRYDANLFDRQLLNLLDALKIQAPVDVAGLSMGGPIVATFAVRHPERVRSILLFDPAVKARPVAQLLRVPGVAQLYTGLIWAPSAPEGQLNDLAHPEKFPDWPDRFRVQMKYKGFRHAVLSTVRDYLPRDKMPDVAAYGRSGKPALLVWGREDRTTPFAALSAMTREAIPQAECHAVDDAGHVPFMEKPEVVMPITVDFLRRVASK